MEEYRNILIPVDGSKESEISLKKATQVAIRNHADVDVLNVLDTRQFVGAYGGMLTGDIIYQITEDSQNYLQQLQGQMIADGLAADKINIHVRFGDPKSIISFDFLKDHHNDLIIIGATGMNAVERLLVGSVSSYVTRNAPVDVIIVKTGLDNKTVPEETSSK